RLARKLLRALALCAQHLLGLRLTLLALLDVNRKLFALVGKGQRIARKLVPLTRNLVAQADELAEIDGERLRLLAHFGNNCAQQHRRAHRSERVLGGHEERRRPLASDALQRRKHFRNGIVPLLQGNAQRLLAVLQRLQARLRLPNAVFHRGNARCGVDDLLVELATIVADLLDLALELGLVLKRAALLRTQLFELLVALLELVESSGRGGRIQVKRAVARRLRALRLRQRTRNSC